MGNGQWNHLTGSWELAGLNLTMSPIRADSATYYNGKDFIRLGFPGTVSFFISLKELWLVCLKFGSGPQMFRGGGLSIHKNTTFMKMRKNILSFPQWEKISIGIGQPSSEH